MDDISNRTLEEWKYNIELHKLHDSLKQKRFSHFLTIQTAFFAIYGLLIKESFIQSNIGLPIVTAVTAIAALIILRYITGMDRRGRAYVDVIKSHLLLLEGGWNHLSPDNQLTTYTNQFSILVNKEVSKINEYQDIRGLGSVDKFKEYIVEPPAHIGEENIIKLFTVLWWFLFGCAILLSISKIYYVPYLSH